MILITIGIALFALGVIGRVLGFPAAILLVGPAMIFFVFGAWRAAHPERGGEVGHADINPWSLF